MDNLDLLDSFFAADDESEASRPPPLIVGPDTKWCVLDLETGGFSAHDQDIAEVGIVAFHGQREAGAFGAILTPYGGPMQSGAVGVHKITHATRLSMGIDPGRVFRKLLKWLEPMEFIVAYNGAFDRRFLEVHIPQFKGVDGDGEEYQLSLPAKTWVDPLDLAQKMGLGKTLPNLKLGTLTKHFGIPLLEAHRAVEDSRATAGVLFSLLEYSKCSLEDFGSGRLSALGPEMVQLPVFEAIYGGLRQAHGGKSKAKKK